VAAAGITGFSINFDRREFVVNKDRIIGAAKQVAGAVKEGAGRAIGDAKLETDGKIETAIGKVQNAKGALKDTLKR